MLADRHGPGRRGDVAVSAILLTWNSAAHVGPAMTSLSRELAGLTHEMVVVDNGSTDESVEIVRTLAPETRIVRNPANLGVARARNQGMAATTGRRILFFDSDADMRPGSLVEMLGFLDDHPRAGVVGPQLVSPDGTVQFSCRRFPTIQGKIVRQLPPRLGAMAPLIADEEMQDLDRTTPHPVDYVIGACQLIRREVFETVGLLDERMFYGPEDVDFCLRAWKAGWEVYYVPSAVVVHHEQRVARRLSVLTLRHGMALGYYFWKHRYLWRRPRLVSRVSDARR